MKGIWAAHKELYQLTSEVIIKKRFELIPELEELLRNKKNYDLFLNILKNPVCRKSSIFKNNKSSKKTISTYLSQNQKVTMIGSHVDIENVLKFMVLKKNIFFQSFKSKRRLY